MFMAEQITLNPKEALVLCQELRPDLTIGALWDYDEDNYLAYVIEKGFENKDNYNDPYYLLNKHGPLIERISSMDDFDKFSRAMHSEPLAKREGVGT